MVEEIVVSGPTQEWIDAAKKKHGKIFSTKISGDIYIYRYLRRSEFRELQKKLVPEQTPQGIIIPPDQSLALEEDIAKLCVVWPENYSKLDIPAGVPSVLSTYITESSGSQIDEAPKEL